MKTLLLIDADTSFQKKLQVLVNPETVKLVVESSGAAAVKSANDLAPDAIILNLELGDVNGFLVCSSLKKSPSTRDIPVVITSSEKTEEDFEQHRKLKFRADGYFRKPVSREDLVSILVEYLGPEAVRSNGANPLTGDFTEENIDKLLDTTFLDFSETGEGEEIAASETSADEKAEAAPKPPDTGEDFLLSDEDIDLESVPQEASARVAPEPEPEAEGGEEDFSDILDDVAPVLDEVVRKEPDLEASGKAETEAAGEKMQTADGAGDIIDSLKQQAREQSVQIISLEKENAFLKNENRELLMNLTSVKADTEERLAEEQEKNAELVRRIAGLEEQLSDHVKQHTDLSEERDRLLERVSSLEPEVEALKSERDQFQKEMQALQEERDRQSREIQRQQEELAQLRQERDSVYQELESSRGEVGRLNDELAETRRGFEEKEAMLLETIENLTKSSRKLEDANQDYRERIQKLNGLLKDAVSTVELPEE